MARGLKITTDNKISIIDIDVSDYREILSGIGNGCSIFEIVGTNWLNQYFRQPVKMLVDEEGLIKDLDFNAVGSWFYGYEEHGNPIVGNVLIFGLLECDLKELLAVDFFYYGLLSAFGEILKPGGSDD